MTVDQIAEALQDRRLPKVAAATGIHHTTLAKIRDRQTVDPSHRVITTLTAYLRQTCAL